MTKISVKLQCYHLLLPRRAKKVIAQQVLSSLFIFFSHILVIFMIRGISFNWDTYLCSDIIYELNIFCKLTMTTDQLHLENVLKSLHFNVICYLTSLHCHLEETENMQMKISSDCLHKNKRKLFQSCFSNFHSPNLKHTLDL